MYLWPAPTAVSSYATKTDGNCFGGTGRGRPRGGFAVVRKTPEAFFVHHERAELSRTTTDSEVGGADLPLGPAAAFSRASESREELCSDRVHESEVVRERNSLVMPRDAKRLS